MNIYKVIVVPNLILRFRIMEKKGSCIQSAEKKFMRYVRGCIKADKVRNKTIK